MQEFKVHKGVAAPLKRSNVDTDQIIPAVYMRRLTKTGFEDVVFENWRTNDPDFVLNQEIYKASSILVAGPDFATGSSREHAVWALKDFGFRVILSSRFADIFRNNSGKQGLLTAVLEQADIEAIWSILEANPGLEIEIDLERKVVQADGAEFGFEVDDYIRYRLLNGLDDIDLTLAHLDEIEQYEAKRPSFKPKTLPAFTRGEAKIESAHYDERSPLATRSEDLAAENGGA
jgi:3-isopropylmalate/(R)-2-methylmalate dehydratase small subunit